MLRLDIAPAERWVEYDASLSFRVRRLPLRELLGLIEGTAVGALYDRAAAGGKPEKAAMPLSEILDLAERAVERMVTDWTVEDAAGAPVPVTAENARWLMTEVRGLAAWLVFKMLLAALAAEAGVEDEKKG